MNDLTRGPTFLFVGPGRAGSNWFFEVLREHPSVYMPLNKGTFFFSQWYKKGVDWYEAFFPEGQKRGAVGESCEDYLSEPEALQRIKDYRPAMRLICCLRNPYERALSHWRFFARNGIARPSLVQQSESDPDVFYMGHYASQLEVARSLFPENQILIFLYEDLDTSPELVVNRLYQFVGVDSAFVPLSVYRKVNVNAAARVQWLAREVHRIHMHSWGASRLAFNLVGAVKRVRPIRRLVQRALYREERVNGTWVDYLHEFPGDVIARYEREISGVEAILGRDLSHWRVPASYSGRDLSGK